MRSVLQLFASRPFLDHWKAKLTVAAVLLAALTIGICSLWQGPQRVYALEDLPNRLLEIRSIYMTGWLFSDDWMCEQDKNLPTKFPMTMFAERPNRFWHAQYGFSGPDMNHKDVRVSSGYAAGNGRELLIVSREEKSAMVLTVPPIENELRTEVLIQVEVPYQLLGGNLGDFTKTGVETVNGMSCEVYEHAFDESRNRLWLNPTTGLPVKMAFYDVGKDGKERTRQVFDHIEVNIPASATGLSFEPPEGYQITRIPQAQDGNILNVANCGSNDEVTLGVWHCFNIDDKAALLYWFCEAKQDAKDADVRKRLEFRFEGTHTQAARKSERQPCEHIEIAAAESGGHHWNWSLVLPKKAGERIGNHVLTVAHHPKKGGLLSTGGIPLRLPEDRLKAILTEAQQLTKTTMLGSSEPFTLETLRARLPRR